MAFFTRPAARPNRQQAAPGEQSESGNRDPSSKQRAPRADNERKPESFDETIAGVSEKDWKSFAGKVAKAGGKAIILVHPWYSEDVSDVYRATRDRLLTQSRVPVIILQEEDLLWEAKERIADLGAPARMVIPTLEGEPTPVRESNRFFFRVANRRKVDHFVDFNTLYLCLKRAGVNQAFVGGLYSENVVENRYSTPEIERHERERLFSRRKDLPEEKPCATGYCTGYAYHGFVENAARDPEPPSISFRLMPGVLEELPWFSQMRRMNHVKRRS